MTSITAPVWTHSVFASRPKGRCAFQFFVRIVDGQVVKASTPEGVVTMTVRKVRGDLYHAARILGDLEAAKQGPTAFARRQARKAVYRKEASLNRRLFKAFKLW